MSWIPVKKLPISQDLTELSDFLRQEGLQHRITEEGDHRQIWVRNEELAEPLAELTERRLVGEVELPESNSESEPGIVLRSGPPPSEFPATVVLIILSVLGALVIMSGLADALVPWFTFQEITAVRGGQLAFEPVSEGIGSGELWRLLTPAFLHFGLFHILFNGLWLWELGRRLEKVLGWQHYVLFVVVTAIFSNVAQYFWSGPSLFGGMSGVVFALIGYLWMRQRYAPHPVLAIPPGLIGFMLIYLVVCLVGIVDMFLQGSVANGAHLGGLIAGMAWGIAAAKAR